MPSCNIIQLIQVTPTYNVVGSIVCWNLWLFSSAGKDATDDFEDVGHSTTAKAMLDEFYVGDIDSSTVPTKTTYAPPKQPQLNQDKSSGFIIKLLQFLVPLLILGVAVGVRFYTKSST